MYNNKKKFMSDIFFINEQYHWIKKKLHITIFKKNILQCKTMIIHCTGIL